MLLTPATLLTMTSSASLHSTPPPTLWWVNRLYKITLVLSADAPLLSLLKEKLSTCLNFLVMKLVRAPASAALS